jgi:hypothetical protein
MIIMQFECINVLDVGLDLGRGYVVTSRAPLTLFSLPALVLAAAAVHRPAVAR